MTASDAATADADFCNSINLNNSFFATAFRLWLLAPFNIGFWQVVCRSELYGFRMFLGTTRSASAYFFGELYG